MTAKASDELIDKIRTALVARFPGAKLNVGPGFHDNVHVLITSEQFRGMSQKQRQDRVWTAIDESDLTASDKVHISMILPLDETGH